MSESMTIINEEMSSPDNGSNLCPSTKTLIKDEQVVSPDIYKNNNNITEDSSVSSPPPGDEKHFIKSNSDSSSEQKHCKMNLSPKDVREDRASPMTGDDTVRMQYSPKSPKSGHSQNLVASDRPSSAEPAPDDYHQSQDHPQHHQYLQQRTMGEREQQRHSHHSSEYGRGDNHNLEKRQRDGHSLEQSTLSHRDFLGGPSGGGRGVGGLEADFNDDMSENEMICDDYESDSESNEPRITVREALMNRALAAAAAAAATARDGSTISGSHFGERNAETFSSEQVRIQNSKNCIL